MDMPKVVQCEVEDCAYNQDSECHALAITIGDIDNPMCDTYCPGTGKGGDPTSLAGVGACKVTICAHNKAFECGMRTITVGWKGNDPDCLSFKKR
jgi:hypothetical protein